MLKIILIVLVVLIAGIVLYASTKPDAFHVERTANIKATPDKLFPRINDFHQWQPWSPYEKLDPAMKRSFSGPAAGEGAIYEWEGNSKAGAGRITITQATPPHQVKIKLEMFKPFAATNEVTFTLKPNGDSTDVTWAMDGQAVLFSKVMGLFFDMDDMVGGQFDEGLRNLTALVEK
jgi:Polyketide cyclase / dehydrase and lipid transport